MAKEKTNKSKSTTKKISDENNTKDLAKKECTYEEKERLVKHKKRKKRRPVKFKAVKSDSDHPIALQDLDDPLIAVKMFEALGTANSDLQNHLLDQVAQTFKGVASSDGFDHNNITSSLNHNGDTQWNTTTR